MKDRIQPDELTAVVLCGGQGTRMGSLTQETPKSLVDVQGRPIIWYIVSRLYLSGLRRFILPVGYLGHQISSYVDATFGDLDCEILCVDTGPETPIGQRIHQVRQYLPEQGSILLTNGDALFDLDAAEMWVSHRAADVAITFATVETISKYGLVVVEDGRIAGFERDSRVSGFQISGKHGINTGLVYSGICMLRTQSLKMVDIANSRNFEAELFPALIAEEGTAQYEIQGFWHSIDTPKDLANITTGAGTNRSVAEPATRLKDMLETALKP